MDWFYRTTFFGLAQQLLLVLFVLIVPISANAMGTAGRLDVNIRVADDAKIQIEQKINYIRPSALEWTIFSGVEGLRLLADGNDLTQNTSIRRSRDKTRVNNQSLAREWLISYTAPNTLLRHNNRDQVFIKLLDAPGQAIIESSITLSLPSGDSQETGLAGNLYSLSGVTGQTTEQENQREIRFLTDFIGPGAILTINASWDKGVVTPPAGQQFRLNISDLDALPWALLGLMLPLLSLAVLLQLLWHIKRQEIKVKNVSNKPPGGLSPCLAGVILRKKIYAEQISALIIDICQRGFLIIVKRGGKYSIVKRKDLTELQPWEREIIEELLSIEMLEYSQSKHSQKDQLYSAKIRDAFTRIYGVITGLSYFVENPHLTRIKIKLIALTIYYGSAVAMVWVAISAQSPYLLMPLAGTMIVAILMLRLAPKLTRYTRTGIDARISWQAFANFLKEDKPLPFESAQNHSFERYLAYSVALGVGSEWAKRFDLSSVTILTPDWFVSYEDGTTAEFASEVTNFTEAISKGITNLKGPAVR